MGLKTVGQLANPCVRLFFRAGSRHVVGPLHSQPRQIFVSVHTTPSVISIDKRYQSITCSLFLSPPFSKKPRINRSLSVFFLSSTTFEKLIFDAEFAVVDASHFQKQALRTGRGRKMKDQGPTLAEAAVGAHPGLKRPASETPSPLPNKAARLDESYRWVESYQKESCDDRKSFFFRLIRRTVGQTFAGMESSGLPSRTVPTRLRCRSG